MKHVVSFSGGKDSTAMLLMMHKLGMPIDEVVFADLGKEHAEIYAHIAAVEARLGLNVTRIDCVAEFERRFASAAIGRGKRRGQNGYGWCSIRTRWCTGMKVQAIRDHVAERFPAEPVTFYVGIAWDESQRLASFGPGTRAPLCDWRVTEPYALLYCQREGFDFGGHYDRFSRASCWCCPLQPIEELYALWHERPELWTALSEMDARSPRPYPVDLAELEERFRRFAAGETPRLHLRHKSLKCKVCSDEFKLLNSHS